MSPPSGLGAGTEATSPSENGGDPLRMPDGALVAKRDAPVGGQAVLEGVMMRGVSVWAVAVRTPDGEIEIELRADRSRGPSATGSGACR